jgi:cation:H+ antiporter
VGGGVTSIFTFISGAVLLIFSAEKLVGYLAGAASGLKVSMFLLALIFTGVEFDDITLGLAFNLEGFSHVALGIVFGTAISFSGVVLALGALLVPSRIKIPRDYIAIFVAAPLVLLAFTLTAPFTVVDGGILIALFLAFIGYVAVRETTRRAPSDLGAEMYEAAVARSGGDDTPVLREAEGYLRTTGPGSAQAQDGNGGEPDVLQDTPFGAERNLPGWAMIGLAVLSLVGIVIGAATTSNGAEGMLESYHLQGSVFGATIATIVLTIGDVFLTVEPIRRGVPEIGIANVIGSLVFSVTGKLGITLLAGGIVVGADVLRWHLPALIVLTAVAGGVMWTGNLKRWHGAVLLGCYVTYWVVSFVVFGTVPADTD